MAESTDPFADRAAPAPALELNSVSKSFHDGESELQVLRGVDLALGAAESLALLGASGNGKSTLLQIAAGLESPDTGEVRVLGQPLASLGATARAANLKRAAGHNVQVQGRLASLEDHGAGLNLERCRRGGERRNHRLIEDGFARR